MACSVNYAILHVHDNYTNPNRRFPLALTDPGRSETEIDNEVWGLCM
jgi:transcription initiation factor IIF auxiliary subunit